MIFFPVINEKPMIVNQQQMSRGKRKIDTEGGARQTLNKFQTKNSISNIQQGMSNYQVKKKTGLPLRPVCLWAGSANESGNDKDKMSCAA